MDERPGAGERSNMGIGRQILDEGWNSLPSRTGTGSAASEVLLAADGDAGPAVPRLHDALQAYERGVIVTALRHCHGRRARTARLLGISRKTLWVKLRDHGIDESELDEN